MAIPMDRRASIGQSHQLVLRLAVFATAAAALMAQPTAHAASRSAVASRRTTTSACHPTSKGLDEMAENKSPPGAAEMAAAKTITMKVLAIAPGPPRRLRSPGPAIMPSEARDTMRLMLAGKIDQWFAKNRRIGRGVPDERDRSEGGTHAAGKSAFGSGQHDDV